MLRNNFREDQTNNSEGSGPFGSRQIQDWWQWGGLSAALLYLLLALLLGLKSVGLQYDEALLQHGAVHMLNNANEPAFMHDTGSWVSVAGRYLPLAVIPYVGAVKDYILLLPFALFGPKAEVARVVNALLGAFGIWGIARLLRAEISARVATIVAVILAIHPAYLDQTLYDNGTVVVWMADVGLICATLSSYKARRSSLFAFLLGFAAGLGVWNRANFIWFLGSALIAAVLVFRKTLLIPHRHLSAMIGGGLLGVAPFMLFQLLSGWRILQFMKAGQLQSSLTDLFVPRLQMLSETLLSDGEQRKIWGGPPLPEWQLYFFPVLLALSVVACFLLRGNDKKRAAWRRSSALVLVLFAVIMMTSSLSITEHHLVMLVPIAVVVVVLAFDGLIYSWKRARIIAVLVASVFVGSALYWNVAAARGLRETGGINMWSDAIYVVNDYLVSNYKGREIVILDWGLQNNLYVLSNAKTQSSERFWGATQQRTGSGTPWNDLISRGGVYLTNSGANRHFPEATQGFLAALAASGQAFNHIEFHQKQGQGYAELYDISSSEKY